MLDLMYQRARPEEDPRVRDHARGRRGEGQADHADREGRLADAEWRHCVTARPHRQFLLDAFSTPRLPTSSIRPFHGIDTAHGSLRNPSHRPAAGRRRLPAHDDAVRHRAAVARPARSSTRSLKDKRIFLAAQHDASIDDPQPEDIYTMGCVANVVQSLKLPDGNIKVLVEGVDRARAVEWKEDKGFYRVVVKVLPKQRETQRRRRGHDEPRGVAVRAVREALEQPALRRDDRRRPRGRPGQAGRHDRRAPARGRGREAEPARDHLARSSASTASPASSKSRSTSSRSIAASSLA